MTFLIAIEGIDGSGKGTQAKQLRQRFLDAGVSAALISFPQYDQTHFGQAVGDFLNGRFGSLGEIHPQLVSLLYSGDRFESKPVILKAMADNDVVVFDRYVASNLAHQGSKVDGDEQTELLKWIQTIEHDIYKLPRPDLQVLLDLPVNKAQELVHKKAARTYTDKKADLQEADGEYLQSVLNVYRRLAETEASWETINCLDGTELKSVQQIGNELWETVNAQRPA